MGTTTIMFPVPMTIPPLELRRILTPCLGQPLASDVRTASLYLIVLALFLLFNVLTLTRRVLGVRGSLLGSAPRAGRASAHSAKSFPTYALVVRSPVSRAAAIATGGLSKGGRGHKSYQGRNQHSIEVAHERSSNRHSIHYSCYD
jgi:hypothetical protein